MKKTWFYLLLFSFAGAIISETSSAQQRVSDSFDISGRVYPYHPDADNQFITFRRWGIMGQIRDTAVLIDQDGYFHVRLLQPFAYEVPMMYRQRYVTLYAKPGEKIALQINGDSWVSEGNILQNMTLHGSSTETTRHAIDFKQSFRFDDFESSAETARQVIDFKQSLRSADFEVPLPPDDSSDREYARVRKELMQKQLAFLERYVKEKNLQNNDFENWCKNDIIYTAGEDIATRCFLGKLNTEITHDKLMSYLSGIPLNNVKARHNSAYYEFIYMLAKDFEIIVNVNDSFKPVIRKQGNSYVSVFLMEVDRHATGFAKQLMYYDIYASNRGKPFSPAPFKQTVTEPVLRSALERKIAQAGKLFVPYDLVQKIKAYQVSDTVKQRLIDLFEKEKGHYVLINFWGIWCAPCMADMPIYPDLINHFKDRPIRFLFLAEQTDESDMEEVRKKYHIPAKFISLTYNEQKILNNVMNFSAVPKHFILDPSTRVIDNGTKDVFLDMINTGGKLNDAVVKGISQEISRGN